MFPFVASRSAPGTMEQHVERHNRAALGASLAELWPVDRTPRFEALIHAIDREDRKARARQMLRKLPCRRRGRVWIEDVG